MRDTLQMSVPTRNAYGNGRGGMEKVAVVVLFQSDGDSSRVFLAAPSTSTCRQPTSHGSTIDISLTTTIQQIMVERKDALWP